VRPPTLRREYLDITVDLISRYYLTREYLDISSIVISRHSLYGAIRVCGHVVLLLDRLAREGRAVYDQGSRRWRLVGVREGG